MGRRRRHPTNVFESGSGETRMIEVFLSLEDYEDLVAGGTVILDETRARFDRDAAASGDRQAQPVVKVVITPREA